MTQRLEGKRLVLKENTHEQRTNINTFLCSMYFVSLCMLMTSGNGINSDHEWAYFLACAACRTPPKVLSCGR